MDSKKNKPRGRGAIDWEEERRLFLETKDLILDEASAQRGFTKQKLWQRENRLLKLYPELKRRRTNQDVYSVDVLIKIQVTTAYRKLIKEHKAHFTVIKMLNECPLFQNDDAIEVINTLRFNSLLISWYKG
jgi:hypothetical protein